MCFRRLIFPVILALAVVSCRLDDNQLHSSGGGASNDDDSEPLQVTNIPSSLKTNASYLFEVTGGVAPYTFSIVSGPGEIDPITGLFRAGWKKESVSISVTDILGSMVQVTVPISSISAINGAFPAGAAISKGLLSEDGTKFVYIADQEDLDVKELFWCDLESGDPCKKLNSTLPTDGDLDNVIFFPDTDCVAYSGEQEKDNVREIFKMCKDGTPLKLTEDLATSANQADALFYVTADNKLVYMDSASADGDYSLKVVNDDGTGRVTISRPPVHIDGEVTEFLVSPNEDYIAYIGRGLTNNNYSNFRLYMVKIDGSDELEIGLTMPTANIMFANFLKFTPDQSRLIGINLEIIPSFAYVLFSTKLDGTGLVQLNVNTSLSSAPQYEVTSDSTLVFYTSEDTTAGAKDLYSIHPDGTNRQKITPALVSGQTALLRAVTSTNRVIYTANQDDINRDELYIADADGGNLTKINGTIIPADGDVKAVFLLPNETHVLYWADQNTDDVYELFYASLDGSGSTVVPGTSTTSIPAGGFTVYISPDSTLALFDGVLDSNNAETIHLLDLTDLSITQMSDPLAPGKTIEDFSANFSTRMLYYSGEATAGTREAFVVGF